MAFTFIALAALAIVACYRGRARHGLPPSPMDLTAPVKYHTDGVQRRRSRFAPALLGAALLLSACGRPTAVSSPASVATAVPTASVGPLPSPTLAPATATAAPPTVTPTATPDAAATAAALATRAANAAQAEAVAHLGAGNTLRQAGNLTGALHEYATARALAPTRPDVASSIATAQALQTATAQAASATAAASTIPVRLAIPALGVNAPVEILGLLADGAMQAPTGWWDAGWYRYGPLPGQTGNAVIAGHLDSTTGPALFWHLTSLSNGARVSVTLSNGQVEDFAVQRQVSYSDNNAPLGQIFGPADTVNLNLITCGGTWNAAQHNYSNRTVVYTRKI
jgi:sortase (surface protein transpeptidase)